MVGLIGSLAVQRSGADDRAVAANAAAEGVGGAALGDATATSLPGADAVPKNVEPEDKKVAAAPETRTVTKRARRVEPLPPPSEAAVKALQQFQQEAVER